MDYILSLEKKKSKCLLLLGYWAFTLQGYPVAQGHRQVSQNKVTVPHSAEQRFVVISWVCSQVPGGLSEIQVHALLNCRSAQFTSQKRNIRISFSALKKPIVKLRYLVKFIRYYQFKMWFGKYFGVNEECTGKYKEKNLSFDISHNMKASHNQSDENVKGISAVSQGTELLTHEY